MTTRDAVWLLTIERLVEEGKLQISDLDIDESKRHTVRRVLKEMEEMGILYRTGKRSKTWRAGDRAEELLNLSNRALVLKDED